MFVCILLTVEPVRGSNFTLQSMERVILHYSWCEFKPNGMFILIIF